MVLLFFYSCYNNFCTKTDTGDTAGFLRIQRNNKTIILTKILKNN